jgi:DNA sulfur modification protein DndD
MITEIRLEKFGKFIGKTFRFSGVTLFTGRNETGKTTLFDALLDMITRPKGNTVYGKALVTRYGADRKADSEYDTSPPEISAADFLNLFAIRSGEISLEIQKDSPWMNQVKSSLFSGGIDPQNVIEKLKNAITGRARGSLNSESARIDAELQGLRSGLKEAREHRKTYLDEEKDVAKKKTLVSKTEKEIEEAALEVAGLEKTIEQQNLLREVKGLDSILLTAQESRDKKEELKKYSRYSPERLRELKEKIAKSASLKTEEEKKRAIDIETQGRKQGYIEDISRCETEKKSAEARRNLAEILWDKLVPREKLIKKKNRRIVRRPVLAAAAAALLAGGVGALLAPSLTFKIAAAGAGVAICCILLVFAFSNKSEEDSGDLEAALKTVRERWREETGKTLDESYEAVLAALESARTDHTASENYNRIVEQLADFNKMADDRARQRLEAENTSEAAARDLRRFYDEEGVADETDYTGRLKTKEHLTGECAELDKKLLAEQKKYEAASPEELQRILREKRAELSGKITQPELPAREIELKRNELREKKADLEDLRRREKELKVEVSGHEGKIEGRFEGLPERIVAFEKAIGDKEGDLAKIRLELSAAAIAKEIFEGIAEDSDAMLEELSREIGATFSTLTDEGRNVSMGSFSADNIRVRDSGGEERTGDLLSTGTRDAFLLAARLVLARKGLNPEQKAIIVLDEPFLALDRPRIGRALAVLEEFHRNEGWQLILFTKDEELETQAGAVFGKDLLVHRLDTQA